MRIGDLTFNQIDNEEYFQDHNLIALFFHIDTCVGERRQWITNVSLYDALRDWFDNYLDEEVYLIWKKRLDEEARI